MLDKLRSQCEELLAVNYEKYKTIANILNNDKCFFEMDIETAYSILKDLKVTDEDLNKVYLELIKIENFEV